MSNHEAKYYRFPGINSFRDDPVERVLFFGREYEREYLYDLISAESLVILYSRSGIGKSSLLQAGLYERLRDNLMLPIPIRLNKTGESSIKFIFDEIDEVLKENKFEIVRGSQETLFNFFETLEIWNKRRRLVKPVLVFDQFEEFFTLSHDPRFKKQFFEQFVEMVQENQQKEFVKIIIAIREEFLAYLDEFSIQIPSIMNNRFWLEPLKPEEAREAIENPAKKEGDMFISPMFEFEAAAIESILKFLCKNQSDDLTGSEGEVEPFQLQLICQHIEQEVAEKTHQESNGQKIIIRESDFGGEEGLADILKNFYDNQIDKIPKKYQGKARELLETTLIIGRRRIPRDYESIIERDEIPKEVLEKLIAYRLLNKEARKGGFLVEISHDTLIEPIIASHEARKISALERREKETKKKLSKTKRIAAVSILAALIFIFLTIFALLINARLNNSNKVISSNLLALNANKLLAEDTRKGFVLAKAAFEKVPTNPLALTALYETVYDNYPFFSVVTHEPGHLNFARFSPDGSSIITASSRGTATLYDLAGNPLQTFTGLSEPVNYVEFSPEGNSIIAASVGGDAIVWDLAGNPISILAGHGGKSVNHAGFSPDGRHLVTAGSDGKTVIWSREGDSLYTIPSDTMAGKQITFTAVFSPDSKQILTAGGDGAAKIWDLKGQLIQSISDGSGRPLTSAMYSRDGQYIVVTFYRVDYAKIFRIEDEKEIAKLDGHPTGLSWAEFAPDSNIVMTTAYQKWIWSLDGELLRVLSGEGGSELSAVFSPGRKYVVSANYDQSARLWDLADYDLIRFKRLKSEVNFVDFSADGKTFLTVEADSVITLWDMEFSTKLELKGHRGRLYAAKFLPEGRGIVSVGGDSLGLIWGPDSSVVDTLIGHTGKIFNLDIAPRKQLIITASEDSSAIIWDFQGKLEKRLRGHQGTVWSARFSRDEKYIATASEDKTVRIWKIEGDSLAVLRGHTAPVYDAVFTPDGRSILSAGDDRNIIQWDWSKREQKKIYRGHTRQVLTLAIANDGRTLLSGGRDQSVRLWSLGGEEIYSFRNFNGSVKKVAYSPDQTSFAAAGLDDFIRLFILEPHKIIEQVEARRINEELWLLSPEERKKYDLEETREEILSKSNDTELRNYAGYFGDSSNREEMEFALEICRKLLEKDPGNVENIKTHYLVCGRLGGELDLGLLKELKNSHDLMVINSAIRKLAVNESDIVRKREYFENASRVLTLADSLFPGHKRGIIFARIYTCLENAGFESEEKEYVGAESLLDSALTEIDDWLQESPRDTVLLLEMRARIQLKLGEVYSFRDKFKEAENILKEIDDNKLMGDDEINRDILLVGIYLKTGRVELAEESVTKWVDQVKLEEFKRLIREYLKRLGGETGYSPEMQDFLLFLDRLRSE